MSEPFWSALGGGAVDYEGAWAAGTAYAPGDVVRYNGVDYLAVNPSTGVNPGAVVAGGISTALPASPSDGDEFTLVDSLTAPTYSWRFRYMAAKATNKWVFIGGSPLKAEVATSENTSSTSFVDLATVGPSIVIPVAGVYEVELGFTGSSENILRTMSYAIGAAAATDADSASGRPQNSIFRRTEKSLAAVTLLAKYKVDATGGFSKRLLSARPIAVGG